VPSQFTKEQLVEAQKRAGVKVVNLSTPFGQFICLDILKIICKWYSILSPKWGVTPIDSIVTTVTVLVNPYTKEGVESLCILLYTSVNVHIFSGQQLKFNAVNGQSPKISVVNGQNAEKSWSKF